MTGKEVTVTEEKATPNATAAIFKLKNLDPQHFRDRVENAITGADGGAVKVETLTDADVTPALKSLKAS